MIRQVILDNSKVVATVGSCNFYYL